MQSHSFYVRFSRFVFEEEILVRVDLAHDLYVATEIVLIST
jgi:subtilisin-like proprotein convertase family protein